MLCPFTFLQGFKKISDRFQVIERAQVYDLDHY